MMNLRTLNPEELERLYYQAGLVEVAAIYAQLADAQAENDEYQEQIEKMVLVKDYDVQVELVEHLQEHIRAADTAASELHDYISDAKKLSRPRLLELLTAIALDPDSEP